MPHNKSGSIPKIPRDKENDFTQKMMTARQSFVSEQTQVSINNIVASTIDPQSLAGNIENALGAAQVPIGLAGPMHVNGEHIQESVYVPLATTEGTLVASYSRGMRLLNAVGGAKVTVVERFMQRAPVFHFEDARAARNFGKWLSENLLGVRGAAESTSSVVQLSHIEQYGVARMWYLRMNFTTGDAAGQNMSGKAAQAACEWVVTNYLSDVPIRYTLSGAIDTDKKHSHLNTLHSRGARVIAEVTIPAKIMKSMMKADTKMMYAARQVSTVGGLLAGTTNNGLHAANAIAALFIATGQDAANVAESQAGITYVDLSPNGDLYWSITLPSIIAATYGGGTGLPTQRECLNILGCYGSGKINRLLEIIGSTVLAGEISLAAAVVAGHWVESHDALGRNRP